MPLPGFVRILLDTNILISGIFIAGSPPARLLGLWHQRRIELVTSRVQLDELRRVLERPKISGRLAKGEAERLLRMLALEPVRVGELPAVHASPDPDDNRILAIAIAGSADLIVSGDRRGMRELGAIHGIPIITAREAVERLALEEE